MKSSPYRNPARASWAEDFSFLNKNSKDKSDSNINDQEGPRIKKSNLKVSDLNLYINKTHIL